MKITRVELQKNDNTRFSLFSGDEYIMSVSAENLAKYGYGEFEISDEELEELKDKEDIQRAYKRAFRYSSRSLKSSKEVRDYLYKHKISTDLHDEIINKLEDLALIDDKRYLEIYLEEKFNFSLDGSIKIKNKLYQKGFKSSDVDPFLPDFKEKEYENLGKLIEKRIKSRKNEDKNKLIRYLLSKGYEYSMINDVIGDYFSEEFWLLCLYSKV